MLNIHMLKGFVKCCNHSFITYVNGVITLTSLCCFSQYLKRHTDSVVSREHFSFSPRMPVGDFYEERETTEVCKFFKLATKLLYIYMYICSKFYILMHCITGHELGPLG